jgi:hypothetical protein
MTHYNRIIALNALQLADNEWQRQLELVFGSAAGDARYDERGRGEAGTPLRRAYDDREAARQASEAAR